jgi:hypothetical protein
LKERTELHRVSTENFLLAQQTLETAAVLIDLGDPIEAPTQRKAFEALMPIVRDLKDKGRSWKEITKYLNQGGFNIKASTVRSYFVSSGKKKSL